MLSILNKRIDMKKMTFNIDENLHQSLKTHAAEKSICIGTLLCKLIDDKIHKKVQEVEKLDKEQFLKSVYETAVAANPDKSVLIQGWYERAFKNAIEQTIDKQVK